MLEVVCAVIVKDGRVLLCRRAAGSHLAGQWEFPGGKVEDGEGPEAALDREIREELGCRVEVGRPFVPVEHHYPEIAIRLRPYRCRLLDGAPEALEHEEIAWFAPGDLAEAGLAGADEGVAAQIGDLSRE
ncbi:MAG: (deoxy)nucleoside triphosphate pyrophosphohydrolase [Akkermansiaceae bacterium]|nr:(deoxy)nucleoside triphosphate pyrophosphohydrolase [Akkermansiaceae bacterium]NNM28800.1 (deoxy)nucleoside triphosphate pyrophosphohydrolase [Akkermansiaceae bacterium]